MKFVVMTFAVFLVVVIATTVTFAQQATKRLPFDAAKAKDYAVKYCDAGTNDCPSKKYDRDGNFDCTHFMAHTLLAGGVRVPGMDAKCETGLVIRVKEFHTWLEEATNKYSNITKIERQDTKAGDFVIILNGEDGETIHTVMLSDTAGKESGKAFSHSADVCGNREINMKHAIFFRIAEPK